VLGATVFREQIARAAPGIQEVFVTNSTREPVPVAEQGGVDVNVTRTPLAVHEQGTATVNVTNAPLSVRVVGEQPVQRELEWTFLNGCSATDTYAVPAGKYLRIEHVSFLQAKQNDYIAAFGVYSGISGSGLVHHYLEHNQNGVSASVRIYAGPGTTVGFPVNLSNSSGLCGGTWRVSFSGVLIDAS
jgi:hypothetical protein